VVMLLMLVLTPATAGIHVLGNAAPFGTRDHPVPMGEVGRLGDLDIRVLEGV